MKISQIYAVYDRKALTYLPVFQADRDISAHRSFHLAIMNTDLPIHQYPSDFDLVHLGSIDTDTGQLLPLASPHTLINGEEALKEIRRESARYASILKSVPETASE